jgi:hypothetical protein
MLDVSSTSSEKNKSSVHFDSKLLYAVVLKDC